MAWSPCPFKRFPGARQPDHQLPSWSHRSQAAIAPRATRVSCTPATTRETRHVRRTHHLYLGLGGRKLADISLSFYLSLETISFLLFLFFLASSSSSSSSFTAFSLSRSRSSARALSLALSLFRSRSLSPYLSSLPRSMLSIDILYSPSHFNAANTSRSLALSLFLSFFDRC